MGGQVLEDWRVSEPPGALTYDSLATSTPIYRQSNVGRLRILLSEDKWDSPSMTNRETRGPFLSGPAVRWVLFYFRDSRRSNKDEVEINSLIPRSASAFRTVQ